MIEKQGIFAEQICAIRKKALSERRKKDPRRAIASWIEKDRLIDKPGEALVIILNSRGCEWARGEGGGCSMCGYSIDTSENISASHLIEQVDGALSKFSDKEFQSIKLFNSGSFLDSEEVPVKAQSEIMDLISRLDSISEVIIETRPEFVSQETLKRLKKQLGEKKELELGIGLESSNDDIRINNINKGFTFEQFARAVKIAIENNARVKSYLLLKPPFLTEKEAITDTIRSAIDAIKLGSRSISINPLNIQNGTLVYYLWRDALYRPPWFWGVREAIKKIWSRIHSEDLVKAVDRILCDPSGAGTIRGVHNCRNCDKKFIKAIKNYSVHQNPKILDTIDCHCYKIWQELLEFEEASRDQSLTKLEKATKLLP